MSEQNYNIQNNEGEQYLKNDFDDKTIYGYEKNKFKGFGEYTNPILKEHEGRINELVELAKKEFPNLDNYFLWMASVDYMMEELGIKDENENLGKSAYEHFLKERNKLIYNSVELKVKE